MSAEGASTLREGRDAYLAAEGLPADGGYGDDWVKFKVLGIPIAFPNSASRKRDAPIHDLHHVLTRYRTDLMGEAEIGAWEIASGCHGAALHLGLRVFGFMLPFRPRRLYRAFESGRHSSNLYDAACDDTLLSRKIDEVRAGLGLDTTPEGRLPGDLRAFVGWGTVAIALVWGPLPFIAAGVWWLLS